MGQIFIHHIRCLLSYSIVAARPLFVRLAQGQVLKEPMSSNNKQKDNKGLLETTFICIASAQGGAILDATLQLLPEGPDP